MNAGLPWTPLNPHAVALGVGILLTSLSHLVLKSGTANKPTWLASFLNGRTVAAYGLFTVGTLACVYAMQQIPLKTATAWSSANYVLVVTFSRLIFKEKVDRRRLLGCGLIIAGVIVFSLPPLW